VSRRRGRSRHTLFNDQQCDGIILALCRYAIKNVPNIAAAMAKMSKVKKVRLARFGGGAA
jgi:hypothetical protein